MVRKSTERIEGVAAAVANRIILTTPQITPENELKLYRMTVCFPNSGAIFQAPMYAPTRVSQNSVKKAFYIGDGVYLTEVHAACKFHTSTIVLTVIEDMKLTTYYTSSNFSSHISKTVVIR